MIKFEDVLFSKPGLMRAVALACDGKMVSADDIDDVFQGLTDEQSAYFSRLICKAYTIVKADQKAKRGRNLKDNSAEAKAARVEAFKASQKAA